MFPLPVVLVSVDDRVLSELRRELDIAGASIDLEFSRPAAAIDGMRFTRKQTRLLIFHWRSPADTPILKRLAATFSGWPILCLSTPLRTLSIWSASIGRGPARWSPCPLSPAIFTMSLKQSVRQYMGAAQDRHVIAISGVARGHRGHHGRDQHGGRDRQPACPGDDSGGVQSQDGCAGHDLDVKPRCTLHDLIRQIDRVDDYLVKKTLVTVAERLRILAGPSEVHSTLTVDPRDLLHIVDCLKILSEVVVLDLPCTFQEVEFEVLSSADHIVLVGLQSVPSIRSLKLIRETLSADHVAMSLWVVINRYNPKLSGFKADEIKQLLDVPRVLTIADDLAAVNRSINQARTLRQAAPNTEVLSDIGSLIFELLGEYPIKPETNHRGHFPGCSAGRNNQRCRVEPTSCGLVAWPVPRSLRPRGRPRCRWSGRGADSGSRPRESRIESEVWKSRPAVPPHRSGTG